MVTNLARAIGVAILVARSFWRRRRRDLFSRAPAPQKGLRLWLRNVIGVQHVSVRVKKAM
jgi:hypothetical protein